MAKMALQVIPNRWTATNFSQRELATSQAGRTRYAAGQYTKAKGPGSHAVRRPTRGLVLKQETFANLKVIKGDNTPILLVDAGSRNKDMKTDFGQRANDTYSNFLLQAVQEDRMEKQQILETFGEAFIFLFGQRARVITFSGVLLNTFDFNWEAEWWENYDKYLRGTKCVENDARVYITYDETIVGGYILGCSSTKNAQESNHVPFQFQLFITSYSNFSRLGDPNADPNLGLLGHDSVPADEVNGPRALLPGETLTGKVGSNGRIESPSLADAARNIDAVRAFNDIQRFASGTLDKVRSAYQDGVVVVPGGITGAFANFVNGSGEVSVSGSGAIQYTTFDQNADEYVTPGSFGVGSELVIQEIRKEGFESDGTLIRNIKEIWENKGFKPPADGTRGFGLMFANGETGTMLVGSGEAWSNQKIEAGTSVFNGSTVAGNKILSRAGLSRGT